MRFVINALAREVALDDSLIGGGLRGVREGCGEWWATSREDAAARRRSRRWPRRWQQRADERRAGRGALARDRAPPAARERVRGARCAAELRARRPSGAARRPDPTGWTHARSCVQPPIRRLHDYARRRTTAAGVRRRRGRDATSGLSAASDRSSDGGTARQPSAPCKSAGGQYAGDDAGALALPRIHLGHRKRRRRGAMIFSGASPACMYDQSFREHRMHV